MVAAQQISNLSKEHSGPLAPWKIEEQAKRKVTHTDEIPKTGRLDVRNFYVKLAGMQDEWVGFSDGEEGSAEGSKDESQEQGFMGFLNEFDHEPIKIPRIKRHRTAKDTSSGVEDIDRAAGHHRLTNDLEIPSPPVVEPVVPLLDRGSFHSRKTRSRSLRASRVTPKHTRLRSRVQRQQERSNSIFYNVAPPNLSQSNTRHSSTEKFSSKGASTQINLSYSSAVSVPSEESDQTPSAGGTAGLLSMSHNGMDHSNSRLVSSNLSKQDRRIHTSRNVAKVTSMVPTAFSSSAIASCAMHATLPSRIGPAEPTAFFPALGQHPPAAVFAVAASPIRVLPIIDSSLSVEASSTNIGGPALDGHLKQEFPAQVQLFDSIPATALQTPVGRPAIASIASMQVSPRPSLNGTINEIIDAENSLMFNIPWYNLCPRTK
ncbi:hypothetical protein BOTNAR_0423g00060 [Botryotinia narcissicola]|uniref:Uncharacterized protein n=1 Tax=Botryotinia narcissicola TaxID=278944 RepID=A0A4Z1HL80_9HELO|nr:hypothetical protein BOTNAR_0423g00060 [Botryotinia narcissicola]